MNFSSPCGEESQKLLVCPREAAHLLDISERKLWSMTSPRGPIPARKLGRLTKYALADLEAFIASTKIGGAS